MQGKDFRRLFPSSTCLGQAPGYTRQEGVRSLFAMSLGRTLAVQAARAGMAIYQRKQGLRVGYRVQGPFEGWRGFLAHASHFPHPLRISHPVSDTCFTDARKRT